MSSSFFRSIRNLSSTHSGSEGSWSWSSDPSSSSSSSSSSFLFWCFSWFWSSCGPLQDSGSGDSGTVLHVSEAAIVSVCVCQCDQGNKKKGAHTHPLEQSIIPHHTPLTDHMTRRQSQWDTAENFCIIVVSFQTKQTQMSHYPANRKRSQNILTMFSQSSLQVLNSNRMF